MTRRTKLNKAMGRHGRLSPDTWRYKFIQYLGYLFWGRKLGYLSWWQHAARSASVLFFHRGKLLLGKRSPNMPDRPNTYGLIGGFVDDFETFAEGLSREVREECGLEIPPETFTREKMIKLTEASTSLSEQASIPLVEMLFIQTLTTEQKEAIRPTREITEFLWADINMIDDLQSRGLLAFQRERVNIEDAFRQVEKLQAQSEREKKADASAESSGKV